MGKSKKPKTPRIKELKRPARLKTARTWMIAVPRTRLVRAYGRHFGVDLWCAVLELQMLGVAFEPAYVEAVRASLDGQRQAKERARREKAEQEALARLQYQDENYALIIDYTEGGVPFGVTWEEMRALEAGEEPDENRSYSDRLEEGKAWKAGTELCPVQLTLDLFDEGFPASVCVETMAEVGLMPSRWCARGEGHPSRLTAEGDFEGICAGRAALSGEPLTSSGGRPCA